MEFIRFSRHFGSGGNDFIIRNPFFLSRSDSPMYMEKKGKKLRFCFLWMKQN